MLLVMNNMVNQEDRIIIDIYAPNADIPNLINTVIHSGTLKY